MRSYTLVEGVLGPGCRGPKRARYGVRLRKRRRTATRDIPTPIAPHDTQVGGTFDARCRNFRSCVRHVWHAHCCCRWGRCEVQGRRTRSLNEPPPASHGCLRCLLLAHFTNTKPWSIVRRACDRSSPTSATRPNDSGREFETDEHQELESFKGRLIYDARVTSEKIDGHTAKVTVTGKERENPGRGRPARGVFQMVNEGGSWRMHQWHVSFGNLIAPDPF